MSVEHPYLTYAVPAERVMTRREVGSAVAWAWVSGYSGRVTVTALGGDAAEISAAVRAVLDDPVAVDAAGLTVPVTARGAVGDLHAEEASSWSWWWTETAASHLRGEDRVVLLDAADPRIDPLLDYSDSAYIRTDDHRVSAWWGVVDGENLLACAAEIPGARGATHIVSVCVHPDARGRGLARAVCAAITRRALGAGAPAVCLEMYVHNAPGRAVYQALGFVEAEVFVSGWLRTGLTGAPGCGD